MWAALTALFIVLLVVTVASALWVTANLISFLQPILIPVAIAAILAYLMDPVVTRMCRGGLGRTKAVVLLFGMVFLGLILLGTWLVPMISIQSANFAKELPGYTQKARDGAVDLIYRYNRVFGTATRGKSTSATSGLVNWLLSSSPAPRGQQPSATVTPSSSPVPPATVIDSDSPGPETTAPTEVIEPGPSKLTSADR